MTESELRRQIERVRRGTLPRRHFIQQMAALGIGAPLAAAMLAQAGVAVAQTAAPYKPTQRGGGGALRLLWWQAPSQLNPHFAVGQKDLDASRLFYEPLATYDPAGNLVPILAAEVPSAANGGVAKDGRSITWKLKQGVTWHDGKPFTADDCVFTWQSVTDPEAASSSAGLYKEVKKVEKVDPHTVRVTFNEPAPILTGPFSGNAGLVTPKHVFEPYKGAKSREAPANLRPIGTGPYKIVEFKPGDAVRGEINRNYHEANRPHFDTVEMKGGGDAVSAARAVIQTGEFDYAWNIQVEDEILKRMEQGGRGRVVAAPASTIERIQLNFADPWTEVDGERASPKTKHPTLTDPAVREALNLLVDRRSVQDHVYGRGGVATRNFLNGPEAYRSPKNDWEFNIDKANAVLETAGWKRGADGVRAKDGRKLKFVFQTSINAPRQKTQQIVKQACARAGIDVELRSIVAAVFFSGDVANPDTASKFYADLQMLANSGGPDPWLFMNQFTSWEIASKANQWQGRNQSRWRSDEYDRLYKAAAAELDLVKRAAIIIRLNELLIENRAVIPVVNRAEVGAASNRLRLTLSGWDSHVAFLKDWWREA